METRLYLLIYQVLIVALDAKLSLCLLELASLLEQLSVKSQQLFTSQFSLFHHGNKSSSIFEFFPELAKLLGALCISTASLANLSNFTSTETDVWIGIIGIRTCLKLQQRQQ